MVVVTGTKRSGTSLWMRMFIEGGLPHIGEAFPGVWGESIRAANPNGFFESKLRRGVFFGTNPDPTTGNYIPAEATQKHALKVFVPGVVRTERAYLHRVVATMRHWRAYARSIHDLQRQEEAWYLEHPHEGKTGDETVAMLRANRGPIPAPVEWFLENYELVRDFAVRRYPIHFCTYEALIERPEPVVRRVFEWVGAGDPAAALKAIDGRLQRSNARPPVASEAAVDPVHAGNFDAFYDAIHTTNSVPRSLLEPLNATWQTLTERYARPDSRRVADQQTGLLEDGPQTR